MNKDKYRIFLKIVETGNLSRAAKALGYTQSGISHVISGLEASLGFQLFVRKRNGVELTANGRKILPCVQRVVQAEDHLDEMKFEINHKMEGVLRIGSFSSVTEFWMPDIVTWYKEHYPHIRIEILDGNYDEIRQWITTGMVDIGFLSKIAAGGLNFIPLYKDPLCVIMPKGHPLESLPEIRLTDVLAWPFIMETPGCDNDIKHLLESEGLHPQPIFQFRDDLEIAAFVSRGLGVSLSQDLVQKAVHAPITARPLSPATCRVIGLASLATQNSVLVTSFMEHIRELPALKEGQENAAPDPAASEG